MAFKILGVNHIAIAPKEVQLTLDFLKNILGLPFSGEELVKEQKVNTLMYETPASLTRIEILDPKGFADGPVAKFLEKKGAGIHHIALSIDDVDAALKILKSKNVKLIDETPRKGAHNTKIIFIHPHATGGVLIELVQQL